MADDNVIQFRRTVEMAVREPEDFVDAMVTYLAETRLMEFVGDGTDTLHITVDGVRALAVLLIVAEDTCSDASTRAAWRTVLEDAYLFFGSAD